MYLGTCTLTYTGSQPSPIGRDSPPEPPVSFVPRCVITLLLFQRFTYLLEVLEVKKDNPELLDRLLLLLPERVFAFIWVVITRLLILFLNCELMLQYMTTLVYASQLQVLNGHQNL